MHRSIVLLIILFIALSLIVRVSFKLIVATSGSRGP